MRLQLILSDQSEDTVKLTLISFGIWYLYAFII